MSFDSPQLRDRPSKGDSPYRFAAAGSDASTVGRRLGKYAAAFGFFLALSAMLVTLQLFQLTSEGSAKTTLRRSIASLTEIDTLVDQRYDDLQLRAQNAAADETLLVEDFPVAVPLTPAEVRGASKERIRDLLLDRGADVLYVNGSSSLRQGRAAGNGRFSGAGLSDRALGFLRSRNHNILAVVTFALAAVSLVLGATLALTCRGFGRIGSLGAVVIMAAVPLVLAGIGARFYMRIASDNNTEYIQREFLEIGQALAWIPIRDALAFLVLGITFLALGIGGAVWADSRHNTLIRYDR